MSTLRTPLLKISGIFARFRSHGQGPRGVTYEGPAPPCEPVRKVATHIPGFDFVADGGLPQGRTTLVAGSAGSCKTIFAAQFLAEGIRHHDEPGVFITFEEQPDDIRRNVLSFGWDVRGWEQKGSWAFVDASPERTFKKGIVADFHFDTLLAIVEDAVRSVGAKRAALDSIGTIFTLFPDPARVRYELYRVISALRKMGITAVLTAERPEEYGSISRCGIEEFATDNVIVLRNVREGEHRRRTIEILKMRGAVHNKGEYTFTVMPKTGIVIIPLTLQLKQRSSTVRVSSGNIGLDQMCGGGLLRDSIILVSGATGTGKTLLMTHFIKGGGGSDERCLVFGYEESREQLARNALGWAVDFHLLSADNKLKVVCDYPESASLEDHLIRFKEQVEAFQPTRIAFDSISALERISSARGFREFLLAVTSYIKQKEITGLFIATTSMLIGGATATESHISTLMDTIVLLRYVEIRGEIRRGISVLKMRGSAHERDVREFVIDDAGMQIGAPFRNVASVQPVQMGGGEDR